MTVLQRFAELHSYSSAARNMDAAKEAVAEVICHQTIPCNEVPSTVEGLEICKAVLAECGLWQED